MVYPLTAKYESTANVTSFTIDVPAGCANGDGLLLFIGYSGGTTNVSSVTGLTGLTQVGSKASVSGHSSYLYKKVNVQASDSSTTLTVTLNASARAVATLVILSATNATEFVDAYGSNVSAAGSTTITTPSVTTIQSGCYEVGFVCSTVGVNPQITAFTAPGTITKDVEAFSSGGGTNPTAVAIGHDFTGKTGASSIGGGSWTATSSGSRSSWTVSVKPQNSPPTCNAGSDQTVAAAVTVSLSASDADAEGAIASRAWTFTTLPPGVSAPTLTGGTTASASFTPTAPGTYVLTYTVTDDAAAVGTDTITIYVTSTTGRPETVITNGGSYTTTGAADPVLATNDESDSTYISSPSTPAAASIELKLTPMPTPADLTGVKIHVKMRAIAATSNSQSVVLLQGATTVQSWTQVVTSSLVNYEFAVGSIEAGTVTDWKDMRVRIVATAS